MKPIAIFFHGLFFLGDRHLPQAGCIISDQITQMVDSGLWDAAQEIHFGINGGTESEGIAKAIIPAKAQVVFHGLQNRNENLTVIMACEFAKTHPGWNILYVHAKGASHDPNSGDGKFRTLWREGMMQDLVINWRDRVTDLETHNIVCSSWMWNMADGTQHIPAGNFLWVTSEFAAQLPSIYLRDRIKVSGIMSHESRYEAEVFWGNGLRPIVKSLRHKMWPWPCPTEPCNH